MALFASMFVVLGNVFLQSTRAFTSATVRSHASSRSQVVMDRLVDEMVTGVFETINPPVPNMDSWIRFRKVTAVVSGSPVYSEPYQIELISSESNGTDGIDNDGDGLIDEGLIRIWEDMLPYGSTPGVEDSPITITDNVSGLTFTRAGSVLLIDLSYDVVPEPNVAPIRYRVVSGVKMRN